MKKLLKIVLSLFMAMALAIQLPVNLVSVVNAEDGDIIVEDHGLYYSTYTILSEEDQTVELTCYYNTESGDYVGGLTESVVLSSTVQGYTVVSIASGAFDMCGDIIEITIPSCITNLEDGAFNTYFHPQTFYVYANSAALQYVIDNNFNYVIIDSTSESGETYEVEDTENPGYYFVYSVISEEDKTAKLVEYYHVGDGGIIEVNIPSTLNGYTIITIGSAAFQDAGDITSFTIPDTVTTFEDDAFTNCWDYTMIIPTSVTTIGEYAISRFFVGTLYVYSNSVGLQYAIDRGLNYEIIDDDTETSSFDFEIDSTNLQASVSYSLTDLLTESEIKADLNIQFVLSIEVFNSIINDEDRAIIEAALDEYVDIYYLGINLTKFVEGVATEVTSTPGPIEITITIPDTLKESVGNTTGSYCIVRLHDGEAEILEDIDSNDDTITFETDKFSTYAIAFVESTKDDKTSTGSTTDTSTSSNSTGSVQTGDDSLVSIYAAMATITILGACVLYSRKRKYN